MPPRNYTTTQPTIWALTDGRPGNDNQVIAVAQALGQKFDGYENRRIEFSSSASIPNTLLGTSDLGILSDLNPPWPDIVIAAGRKLSRVARIIKKESPQTKIIQLMWPGYGIKDFDLIFAPEHDELAPCRNLITTNGPPNLMTEELLKASAEKWQHRIPIDEKTSVAILIGNISEEEARRLISILNGVNAYLMITTSRRTPRLIIKLFKENITKERYFYEWAPHSENPYLGMMALANFVIPTEDSISMMSESATSGKPTYIFPTTTSQKHKRFSQGLVDNGKARWLENESLETYSYEPLNTLDFIVSQIQKHVLT